MTRPLTKRGKDGNLYARPAEIEKAIEEALTQDIAVLQARADVADRKSIDYLRSECLVYVIREAKRSGDELTMNGLLPLLLARCEAILTKKIPDHGRPNAPELREEILGEFGMLFAEDGEGEDPDELDFFECRFNLAFRTFRIDFLRSETARTQLLGPLPEEEVIRGAQVNEERVTPLPEALRTRGLQLPNLQLAEILDAINSLPSDERKAIILCSVLGYREESDDPAERTAASVCGVTGRTIRNRLTRAAEKLSQFK